MKRVLTGLVNDGSVKLLVDLGSVATSTARACMPSSRSKLHARTAGGDLRLCALQDDAGDLRDGLAWIKAVTIHATPGRRSPRIDAALTAAALVLGLGGGVGAGRLADPSP